MKSPLCSKWNLAGLTIPNRIVMAPMSTNRVDFSGNVTPGLTRYLVRRARGRCGMIILEAAAVDAAAGGTHLNLRLDRDSHKGTFTFKGLISQLHSWGTVVAAQLWHAGPRAYIKDGLPPSPSGTAPGFPDSRAVTVSEIKSLVRAFVQAGERAANTGFDALEIHAAHGYLLHHFIDKNTNRRRDAYGGSMANRFRILEEICEGIKAKHPRLPILLRISLGADDDFPAIASCIQDAGFDAVDLRTGFSSMPKTGGDQPVPEGYTLPLARKLRPHLRLPLITGGRILTPQQAEQAVLEDGIDAVVLGRALLADPGWPRKAFKGQAVVPCLYDCELSCYSRFKQGEPLGCVYYGRQE